MRTKDAISPGHASDPHHEVDNLVAADAEEDGRRSARRIRHAAQIDHPPLDRELGRIGIAVQRQHIEVEVVRLRVGRERVAERVLVGVEQDAVAVVVTRAAIRLQREDVRADE